jgi:hypothetical protein
MFPINMEYIGKAVDSELLKHDSRSAYEGPLGEVIHIGHYFFAWKEGFRIGRYYDTLEEALEALAR